MTRPPSPDFLALIVDDEPAAQDTLSRMLTAQFQSLRLVGKVNHPQAARSFLQTQSVDLVFLDVEMPGEDGFSFLQSLPKIDFRVIFVTAHQDHALKALRASAVDYLLKPVEAWQLGFAVENALQLCRQERNLVDWQNQLAALDQNLHPSNTVKKIVLAGQDAGTVLSTADIVRFEGFRNYTWIHLANGTKHLSSKTLRYYQELLEPGDFLRVHKSHLVHLHYVHRFSGQWLEIGHQSSYTRVPLSKRRRKPCQLRMDEYWNRN